MKRYYQSTEKYHCLVSLSYKPFYSKYECVGTYRELGQLGRGAACHHDDEAGTGELPTDSHHTR